MSTIVIKGAELAQAMGLCNIEADDFVIDLPAYTPVDYSMDWGRDDDEVRDTCGLCEDSIEIIERLAGKTCFDLSQRDWDFYGERAAEIEFAIRRRDARRERRERRAA